MFMNLTVNGHVWFLRWNENDGCWVATTPGACRWAFTLEELVILIPQTYVPAVS